MDHDASGADEAADAKSEEANQPKDRVSVIQYLSTLLDGSLNPEAICKPHVLNEADKTRSEVSVSIVDEMKGGEVVTGSHSSRMEHNHSPGDVDSPPELCTPPDVFSERIDHSTKPLVKSTKGSLPDAGGHVATLEQVAHKLVSLQKPGPNNNGSSSRASSKPCRLPSKREHVRYLHIPRHSLKDFKSFARDAHVEAQCELAADNPYVRALVNYRAEMQALALTPGSGLPSVAQRLSTERENLSVLSPLQLKRTVPPPVDTSCSSVCTWCRGRKDGLIDAHEGGEESCATERLVMRPALVCAVPWEAAQSELLDDIADGIQPV